MRGQRTQREKIERGIWRRYGADGRPRYEITYRDSDGRQRREVVEGGIRAARTKLADTKARMGRGERIAPTYNLTFADAAEQWMEAQGATLRPATIAAYRSSLDTHLLPQWGRLRLDRISVDTAASLVERMQTTTYRREVTARMDGRRAPVTSGYQPWTIRGVLTPAGRVFDYARRRLGWAGTNPVRDLDRSERPRHADRERRILSGDELARLIAAAKPPYREVIATAAGLGSRLGETLGLTWRDLDLDAGTVTIRHQIDRRGQRVELKTKRSRRVIEAPGSVVAMLREHKIRSDYSQPGDLVFTSRTGGPLEHRNVARRGLAPAVKAAGLDADGQRAPTMHELRHAHASAWIADGGDLVELSARLGHRDPAITASVYSHEFEKAARSDARRTRLDSIYGADGGSAVAASDRSEGQQTASGEVAEPTDMQAERERRR